MFRGLLYGSYRKPRELTWLFGVGIFLVPDGRSLLRLPAALGPDVLLGRPGDRQPVSRPFPWSVRICRSSSAATSWSAMRRSEPLLLLHVIAFPLVLLGLVAAHVLALHETGSNNPDGVEIKANKDENGISPRRHPLPSVLHGEGTSSAWWSS